MKTIKLSKLCCQRYLTCCPCLTIYCQIALKHKSLADIVVKANITTHAAPVVTIIKTIEDHIFFNLF